MKKLIFLSLMTIVFNASADPITSIYCSDDDKGISYSLVLTGDVFGEHSNIATMASAGGSFFSSSSKDVYLETTLDVNEKELLIATGNKKVDLLIKTKDKVNGTATFKGLGKSSYDLVCTFE